MHYFDRRAIVSVLALSGMLAGCGGGSPEVAAGPVEVKIAGSTFSKPAYTRWVSEFSKDPENKKIKVSYTPSGSGAAVDQLMNGAVDISATSMPVGDEELAKFKVKPIHIPVLVGAVVPVYNLPKVKKTIRFSAETLANIYLGRIREWNDPDMVKENPGVDLPPTNIVVMSRSDVSGTSHDFAEFLSKSSPAFKTAIGDKNPLKFPIGKTAEGSEALADAVLSTPNAIGYVEMSYAIEKKLEYGAVKNQAGEYVKGDLASMAAAADSVGEVTSDLRISLLNAPAKKAYPITTFSWLLVPGHMPNTAKRLAVKGFIRWVLAAGQNEAMQLDYGTLPQAVSKAAIKALDEIQQ